MNKNIENFVATLTKKGIKPSQHRIKILEYLTTKRNHPTVDKIFNDLIREIPTNIWICTATYINERSY